MQLVVISIKKEEIAHPITGDTLTLSPSDKILYKNIKTITHDADTLESTVYDNENYPILVFKPDEFDYQIANDLGDLEDVVDDIVCIVK